MNGASAHGQTGRVRFFFEEEDRLWCYEAGLNPPQSGICAKLSDIESQMERDNLSMEEIADTLGRCARLHPDIEKVSIHHAGNQYSVVVILRGLSESGVADAYDRFEQACAVYGPHRPIVTVLGPQQRDCPVLSNGNSRVVYVSEGGDMPATPPLA